MRYVFKILTGALVTIIIVSCTREWDEIAISSPDYRLQLIFNLEYGGVPYYKLNRNGSPVIRKSALGFVLNEMDDLDSNFILADNKIGEFNETWEQPWGEVREIENKYHELTVFLKEKSGLERKLNITFRLYNDGLGFRYEFPEQDNLKEFQVIDEKTQFITKANENAWWIPAYRRERYEYVHKKTSLAEMDTVHTPLTIETKDGLYLCIHEAALYDYPSMTIFRTDTNILACDLVPWKNGIKAYVKTPFNSPWRTIAVGEKPADLITNYLILNLNDTSKIEDVSWIEPAKYIGIWWMMHLGISTWESGPKHGATTENAIKYIDFAAKHGIKGVLVEGWNQGWDREWLDDGRVFSFTEAYPDFNLEKVVEYANSKGVEIVGHHETYGAHLNYEDQMEDAYKYYHDLGIRYLKTGYVSDKLEKDEWHHGQAGVRHYQNTVEMAAKYRIMMDIHEPVKDCGLRRTWPNLMTREGARGMEYNVWGGEGGNAPSHVPVLVFTRMLASPMDYTPGIFEMMLPSRPNNQVNTTLAKQLAYYVVIYSPLQMAADLPENYEGNPAFKFIEDVVCDWEDTKALDGEIGEFVTIVRKDRNSNDWYLGSITNEEPRQLAYSLKFLDKDIQYIAQIYADGKDADWKTNPYSINIYDKIVTSKDSIQVYLAPGGGQAIRFVAEKVVEEEE
ncbi:MAG: glycoside hydrolase family 97 protein [Bacteroidales bacterium]|nr:glycoside hydrolase family 97 protein [Bacteroidales bacterium]